jgi:hypothetical protein
VVAECIAPGNLRHLDSTGGFASGSLLRKLQFLGTSLLQTPIPLLAAIISLSAIFRYKKTVRFIRANLFYMLLIVASLALAAVSITALRQLFAPSLFAIILIVKWLKEFTPILISKGEKWVASTSLLLLCCLISGAWVLRKNSRAEYEQFLTTVVPSQEGGCVAYGNAEQCNYQSRPLLHTLLGRYDMDPFERSAYTLCFESHNRSGLSRLHMGSHHKNAITAILPYPPHRLAEIAQESGQGECRLDSLLTPTQVDERYCIVALPKEVCNSPKYLPYTLGKDGKYQRYLFEKFSLADTTYYLMPTPQGQIKIAYQFD